MCDKGGIIPPNKGGTPNISMEEINMIKQAIDAWTKLELTLREKDRLSRKFTVEFNYNSNHIEGNTLTYGQTELLLLFGKVAGEAEMHDLEEMKASNVGLKMMTVESENKEIPLTQNFIRQLHLTLLREDYTVHHTLPGGVQTSYVIHAGQYKTRPNSVITRYGDRFDYASPEETPALMSDLVNWFNEEETKGELAPYELAALFHYRYIRIHPFEDGNGRIARLLVNYILARHGYPMVVIRSRKKKEYLEALHQSDLIVGPAPSEGAHADLSQIKPFLEYFYGVIAEEIMCDVKFVTEKGDDVWWYDGEQIRFRSHNNSVMLHAMIDNKKVTIAALQQLVGINKSAVQKFLKQMTDKGYVSRNEDGTWRVIITPSM